MPTILEQLADEIARSRSAEQAFGGHMGNVFDAWTVHEKALLGDTRPAALMAASRGQAISLSGGRSGYGFGERTTGLPPALGENPYYSGPQSLFGVLGADENIISTRVQPRGISGSLPSMATNNDIPYYPYLTGFLADAAGSEQDAPCDDPIEAGPGKSAYQTAQFGRIERSTRTVQLDRMGHFINRGEMLDLRLMNDPLLMTNSPTGADMTTPQINGNPSIFQETLMRMVEVGVSFQNKLSKMLYTGSPANNSGGGGYKEFPGLQTLVGTAKYDAITGASVPALQSLVQDFGYQRVDSSAINIVDALTYTARYVQFNADRMNLNPTTWVIAMRQELFYEVSAVWPCAYLTYRCNITQANSQEFVDAGEQVRMRDSMRAGRYLLIDGNQWPVVFDDGIPEYNSANQGKNVDGCFSSDIYFIPVTMAGGVAATYFEYFDWRGQYAAMSQLADGNAATGYFWTDDGRFLWHFQPPTNFCLKWLALIEPRIILKAPFLAARIENVGYCPTIHTREPFPGDEYFYNGGVSTDRATIATLSPYSDWNTP